MNNFRELKCFRWDYMDGDLTCIMDGDYGEWFWNPKGYGVVDFILGSDLGVDEFGNKEDFKTMTEELMESGYFLPAIKLAKEAYGKEREFPRMVF